MTSSAWTQDASGKVLDDRLDVLEATIRSEHDSQSEWMTKSAPDVPEMLYHYTDSNGLIGIFNRGELWASNVLHVNDASETAYPMAAAEDIAGRLMDEPATKASRSFRDFLEVVPLQLNATATNHEKYVVCFCDDADLLSQWRGYTGASGGYAIGFDTTSLDHDAVGPHPGRHAILVGVLYDDVALRNLIEAAYRTIKTALDAVDATGPAEPVREGAIGRSLNWLEGFVIGWGLHFKHPTFSEEREWRLVYPVFEEDQDPSRIFRTAHGRPLPYITITFDTNEESDLLPVSDVVCGPSPYVDLSIAAVRLMVSQHGYTSTVRSSAIPLRS